MFQFFHNKIQCFINLSSSPPKFEGNIFAGYLLSYGPFIQYFIFLIYARGPQYSTKLLSCHLVLRLTAHCCYNHHAFHKIFILLYDVIWYYIVICRYQLYNVTNCFVHIHNTGSVQAVQYNDTPASVMPQTRFPVFNSFTDLKLQVRAHKHIDNQTFCVTFKCHLTRWKFSNAVFWEISNFKIW